MITREWRWIGPNLLLLLVVLFPVWFLVLGSWVVGTKGPQGGNYLLAALFYFLMMAVPLLLGGCAQQLVLYLLPRRWTSVGRRIAVVIAGLVTIPSAFLVLNSDPRFILSIEFLLSLFIALSVYGAFVRLPQEITRDEAADEHS